MEKRELRGCFPGRARVGYCSRPMPMQAGKMAAGASRVKGRRAGM